MIQLIGNKNEFAVEYDVKQVKPYLTGNVCLWIGNSYIGYFHEEVMLNSVRASLCNLKRRLNELQEHEFENKSVKEIFEFIYSDRNDNGKFLLNLGESFDDFSVSVFKKNEFLTFIWRLTDKPFFEYPDYKKDIRSKTVPISIFLNVIDNFNTISLV